MDEQSSSQAEELRKIRCSTEIGRMHDQLTKRVRAFGEWDSPMTDDAVWIHPPIGEPCVWCEEPIAEGDNGCILLSGQAQHRECSLRGVMGGIGHLVDHDRYCHGEFGPNAGLSYRQSALMVWDYYQETQLQPTDEQLEAWRRKVEEARS